MKKVATLLLFFAILFLMLIIAGCVESPDSSANQTIPENETEVAISTALNNSTVQSYLTGSWRIMTVNPDGYVTIASGGKGEVTIGTTNVLFETETNVVHAYVNVCNRTVVYIWTQPKKAQMPARTEVTPLYPADTVTGDPENPGNVQDLRHTAFFRFDGWENPANYTTFCPPSYVPREYILFDLLVYSVLNETESNCNYTTVGETLRYALNSTRENASWTTDITFLEVSWSEHGYNPYKKNEISGEDPKSVDINGSTGWIYETEQNRLIVWTTGNATYRVYGVLNREELFRVARSIIRGKGDIGVVSAV